MVMVIAPVVFFAVYSNFSAGVRLWTRLAATAPDEDLNIFYIKVSRDLRGMRRFVSIPTVGDKEEFEFPATIEAPPALGGDHGIGQIRLYYDGNKHMIKREIRDYSQVYKDAPGSSSVLLKDVDDLEFSYLTVDPLEAEPVWRERWTPEPKKLPLAVRMTFTQEGRGRQERTEYIPVGGQIQ